MDQQFIDTFRELDRMNENAELVLKQKRGLDFEKLMNDLFDKEGVLIRRSYHTSDGRSEQIDGAIEVYNRVFLVEVKWVASDLAASDLYSFIGKVENKIHGTLGIFISRNSLSNNFLNALNKGRRQSVVVVHGEDIDYIFEKKVSLKEYIEKAFKVLSYNNVTHYPVASFLDRDKKELATPTEPTFQGGPSDFIEKRLFGQELRVIDLSAELEFADRETLDKVFSFAVQKYGTAYADAVKTFDFVRVRNFETFIKSYTPNQGILLTEAAYYYGKLLPGNINLYGRSVFLDIFSSCYKDIDIRTREKFETFIADKFSKILGDYDMENILTKIVKPIWWDLDHDTKYKLAACYLDIYVDATRQPKFDQKKFALDLVDKNQISEQIIHAWLADKLRNAISSYDNVSVEDEVFIAKTYLPAAKLLHIGSGDWVSYIHGQIEGLKD